MKLLNYDSPAGLPAGMGSDGDSDGDSDMVGGEQCLPLSMLAQPDSEDQMQAPEVGDTGSMTVEYEVTRIDGQNAYIKPKAINGQPIPAEAEKPTPEDEDESEGNSLRGEAEAMGQPSDEQSAGAAA